MGEIPVLTLLSTNFGRNTGLNVQPQLPACSPHSVGALLMIAVLDFSVGLQCQPIKIHTLGYLKLLPSLLFVVSWKVFSKQILTMPQRVCVPANPAKHQLQHIAAACSSV